MQAADQSNEVVVPPLQLPANTQSVPSQLHSLYTPHKTDQCAGEGVNSPRYSRHKLHVFVMTQGGRPVYVRYGDPVDLSSFLATLSAIVEKYCQYYYQDTRSRFQKVTHRNKVIYFLYRKSLCYICCAEREL
jgi:actin-related protein 3